MIEKLSFGMASLLCYLSCFVITSGHHINIDSPYWFNRNQFDRGTIILPTRNCCTSREKHFQECTYKSFHAFFPLTSSRCQNKQRNWIFSNKETIASQRIIPSSSLNFRAIGSTAIGKTRSIYNAFRNQKLTPLHNHHVSRQDQNSFLRAIIRVVPSPGIWILPVTLFAYFLLFQDLFLPVILDTFGLTSSATTTMKEISSTSAAMTGQLTTTSIPEVEVDFTQNILGGGWELVRRVKAGLSWHNATDQLRGTDVYGTFVNDPTIDSTFSRTFDSTAVKDFLFATGDGAIWLVTSRDAVFGFYANQDRQITLSSTNSFAYSAKWYRRQGNPEDPWISLVDHHQAYSQGLIIYGENNFGLMHASTILPHHNGANVWVRY